MPKDTRRKLLPLLFVLVVAAAACAEAPAVEIDVGSGVRFVPAVADPLNDAGRYTAVAVADNGLPIVAYFGFQEDLEEGEVAPTRPIGTPSLPSVMLATVSEEGFWTRGAVAMAEQITNVTVPFNPAFEPTVADLTPQNVTGLSLVTTADTYHVAWASGGGVYHATGSLDPATTTQATVSQVSSAPGLGLSLAVDEGGAPWIAFYTSTSSVGTVDLATPAGDRWQVDAIAEGGGCETCRTAVMAGAEGVAVAYSVPTGGVQVAQNDGENGWVSFEVAADGGAGLSGAPTADGFALAFYGAAQATLATGTPGSFSTNAVAEVAEGSTDLEGARTSVAVGDAGEISMAWADATAGIVLATGPADALAPVPTGSATVGGAYPSVAVGADPANVYVGWYDVQPQDALVGAYGDVGEIPVAQPSPTSTEPIEQPAPPTQECTPVEGGTVTVVAEGIAFTDGSCIEAVVGEPFTIVFDNRDAGTQHNVQIYDNPEPTGDLLMEGEIITGAAQVEYEVPAFEAAGEFAFICVVHPNMLGSVQVVEAAGGGGGGGGDGGGGDGGGGAVGLTVTAFNLAFDTTTIDLPAGEATSITFVNDDAGVQHNIAIYEDDTLAAELFNGELITGPAEIVYEIPALEAGEYYFLCIVHPTMNGTVVVA
ncbi:MAG TPA: cupredoxin domain-containing protein [Actinomycetota bacterium]|nr:cupredoxin domain-containing protein [Actinomycetota bacterium]